MYKRLLILSLVLMLSVALSAASGGGVCFTHEEVAALERLKSKAIARKKHIRILERQIEKMTQIAAHGRREREKLLRQVKPCPRCRCLVPWLVTGLTAGACTVGMITVGVIR